METGFQLPFCSGLLPNTLQNFTSVTDINGNTTMVLGSHQSPTFGALGAGHFFRCEQTVQTDRRNITNQPTILFHTMYVPLRYAGENNAKAYTTGIDSAVRRICPRTNQWILLVMKSKEDVLDNCTKFTATKAAIWERSIRNGS